MRQPDPQLLLLSAHTRSFAQPWKGESHALGRAGGTRARAFASRVGWPDSSSSLVPSVPVVSIDVPVTRPLGALVYGAGSNRPKAG